MLGLAASLALTALLGGTHLSAIGLQEGGIFDAPQPTVGGRAPTPAPQPAAPTATVIDMTIGTGETAARGDVLTLLYRGSLQTGRVFDETVKRPPFAFTLGAGRVIKGLDDSLVGMKVGGKRIILIPPALGYGERGLGNRIPGNANLVFEVELLRVDKPGQRGRVEITDERDGEGRAARNGDTVELHYTGSFLNGHKFDSSRDRGQPFTVELGRTRIIRGFEQAIVGMRPGGKRKAVIPFFLGYGERGVAPAIPGFSTLVFEIEVLNVAGR